MSADGNMTIWMRLRNAREVAAGLKSTAASVGILGTSVDRLAAHLDRAGRRTFLMNQALFTLRRYSYMITLGLTAGAAAVVKWGFDYNTQMQNTRVALHQFGLTQAQVNGEVARLYKIAAITPFLFTDISNSARRFMAFGLSLGMTNRLISNITDSLTAMGFATGASLNRATLALSHMYSLGRLTGQTVYQLARDNIPMVQALEKELGLTGDQLRHVANLGISAGTAMDALNKYIEETPRFHNAAMIFATRTWQGIVTTTRDYMAQFLGQIEHPMFVRLQAGARSFMEWLTSSKVNQFAAKGDIAGVIGTVSPNAARVWRLLSADLHSVWNILVHGLIPAFRTVGTVMFPTLYGLVYILSQGLQFLGHHTLLAKLFFGLLALELGIMAGRFLLLLPLQSAFMIKQIVMNTLQRIAILLGLGRIATIDTETGSVIANNAAKTKAIWVETRLGRAIRLGVLGAARQLGRYWSVLTTGMVRGANGQFVAMSKTEKMVRTFRLSVLRLSTAVKGYALAVWGATRATIVFLFTSPLGWAILLTGALIALYIKWGWFRNAVNNTSADIVRWAPAVAAALTLAFGPLGAAVGALLLIIKYWSQIKNDFAHPGGGLTSFVGGLGGGGKYTGGGVLGNWLSEHGTPTALTGAHRIGVKQTSKNGQAVRSVKKTAGGISNTDLSGGININLENHQTLEADGKKLAEVVSKHRLDTAARR